MVIQGKVLSRIVRNFRLHRTVDIVVVFQEGPRPFLKMCRLFFALRRLTSEWPLSTARWDKLSRQTSLPSTPSSRCWQGGRKRPSWERSKSLWFAVLFLCLSVRSCYLSWFPGHPDWENRSSSGCPQGRYPKPQGLWDISSHSGLSGFSLILFASCEHQRTLSSSTPV